MAKTAAEPRGAAGSQFFVVTADELQLPGDYAVIGEVTSGFETRRAHRQARRPPPEYRRIPSSSSPSRSLEAADDRRRRPGGRSREQVRLAQAAPVPAARARARARERCRRHRRRRRRPRTGDRRSRRPLRRLGARPGASLRCGLEALAPDVEAAVVVLADGPHLAPAAIDRVVAAWRESGADILAASLRRRPRPPGRDRARRVETASRTRAPAHSSRCSSPATTSALQETSIRPMNGRRTPASRRNETTPHGARNRTRPQALAARAGAARAPAPRPRGGGQGRPDGGRGRRGSRRAASTASASPDDALLALLLYTTALEIDHYEARQIAGLPVGPRPFSANPRTRLAALAASGRAASRSPPPSSSPVASRSGRAKRRPRSSRPRPALPKPWQIDVDVLNGNGDITYTRRSRRASARSGTTSPACGARTASTIRETAVYYERGGYDVADRLARQLGVGTTPLPGGDNPKRLVVIVGPHRGPR